MCYFYFWTTKAFTEEQKTLMVEACFRNEVKVDGIWIYNKVLQKNIKKLSII